jgi:hypothetical protein
MSKVAVASCCVGGSVSRLALNQAPLRFDWKATRLIEPDTRGVEVGMAVSVGIDVLVVVGLGVGFEVAVPVNAGVVVGFRGGAVPHPLNMNTAVATRIAINLILVFIAISFIVCEHCCRTVWLCVGMIPVKNCRSGEAWILFTLSRNFR